ncbi:MAG: hypothetical protein J7M05_01005 [Anaerolineae bacterium]|nr:hypothetical protein [Anaerolineae bacterium]
MGLRRWLAERLLAKEIAQRVQEALSAQEEPPWRPLTGQLPTGRPWHEVRSQLERIHQACRTNPLAARLVAMTTDFVIGAGGEVEGHPFALRFWRHPLNRLETRIYRWCDELTRSGELFLVLSRNPVDGMSYVREVPALQIDRIETDPDDCERELRYHQLTEDLEGRWWPSREDPEADQIMLHYAINRPVGELRGTSDLAQIVPWLERYDLWLEDRVRINRYKGAYLWHVRIEGAQPGQLEAKRAQYSRVPRPGSIIVTDGSETWTAIQPQIGADDVEADGKAIRLMIAAGAGVPLHFLAEGESATRATAREMGTATYRHFAHRQHIFASLVEDVIRVAARRAGLGEISVRVRFEEVLAEDWRAQPTRPPEGGAR